MSVGPPSVAASSRATFFSGYFYGRSVFEPKYILLQIWCLQIAYYTSLAGILLLLATLSGLARSNAMLFDPERVKFDAAEGRLICAAFLLNSIVMGVLMSWVVERSKKCLDFAATTGILHLIIVVTLHDFPWRGKRRMKGSFRLLFLSAVVSWWVLVSLSSLLSALVAERLCRRKEGQELKFTFMPVDGDEVELGGADSSSNRV